MSDPPSNARRTIRGLLLAGLVLWALTATWQLWQTRRATSSSAPPRAITAAERIAASRFLAKAADLRGKFVAVATAAERREGFGADVTVVRHSLQRMLLEAAAGDRAGVQSQLRLAEVSLDRADSSTVGRGDSPDAVIERLRQVEPALLLNKELMTEGCAAAEKLVARAGWCFQTNQFSQAVMLVDLAGQLLGGCPPVPPVEKAEAPKWFLAMAHAPPAAGDKRRAEEAVRLCESIIASQAPSRAVLVVVDRARRELDAGRFAEATWWTSVAMDALGMAGQAGPEAGAAAREER